MQDVGTGREALWGLQNEIIHLIADDCSIAAVASAICKGAEAAATDTVCSILGVRNDELYHLAGPSLPESYAAATDGLPIGPAVGSCGTAAFLREPVLVLDIRTDPLWADYQVLARQLVQRACWSTPVLSNTGEVVATFAFYFAESRAPTAWEREVVCRCSRLIAIALQYQSARAELEWQALHDPLTGLSNRRHFRRVLSEMLRDGTTFALVLLDLDDLKGTNDRFGHAAGDAVISEVGNRLRIWAGDCAFRLGGDEFAIIVKGCSSDDQLSAFAHKLLASLNGPLDLRGCTTHMLMTAGGVLGTGYEDAETILQNADFALYHAKECNRGGFVPFESQLRTAILARQRSLAEVDEALREGRILPYYQPIVRVQNAEIWGFEALARMVLKDGSIVPAASFSEAFFDPRIGREVGDAMFRQVSADIGKWGGAANAVHVTLNVTTADFQRRDLGARLEAAMRAHDIPSSKIVIEINEAVYLGKSDSDLSHQVRVLREAGFLIALDDFGTGYASLSHLLHFPVDLIKLDRSLVAAAARTENAATAIISGIMEISHKLGIRVISEGVETENEASLLASLGCVYGQGYLYSAAMPFSQASQMKTMFARKRIQQFQQRAK